MSKDPTPQQVAAYLKSHGLLAVPQQQAVQVGAPTPLAPSRARAPMGPMAPMGRRVGGGRATFTGVLAGTYAFGLGSISVNSKGQVLNVTADAGGGADWRLDGNTNGVERWIGTADAFGFPIRTNNIERMEVLSGGDVEIHRNLDLDVVSAFEGVIRMGGSRVMYRGPAVGTNNFFVGTDSGNNTLTGQHNSGHGRETGFSLSSGAFNTMVGSSAGFAITTGQNNTVVGRTAGFQLSTQDFNTLIGREAGVSVAGDGNTMVGDQAGTGITSGTDNVFIGRDAGVPFSGADSDKLAIENPAGRLIQGDFSTLALGFRESIAVTKASITGSRSGATVAVITLLLTALDEMGLISDDTTA